MEELRKLVFDRKEFVPLDVFLALLERVAHAADGDEDAEQQHGQHDVPDEEAQHHVLSQQLDPAV